MKNSKTMDGFKISLKERNNIRRNYSKMSHIPIEVRNRFSVLKDESNFVKIPDFDLNRVQNQMSSRISSRDKILPIEKGEKCRSKISLRAHETRNRFQIFEDCTEEDFPQLVRQSKILSTPKRYLHKCRFCNFKKRQCNIDKSRCTATEKKCTFCNKKGHHPQSLNCKRSRKAKRTTKATQKNKSVNIKCAPILSSTVLKLIHDKIRRLENEIEERERVTGRLKKISGETVLSLFMFIALNFEYSDPPKRIPQMKSMPIAENSMKKTLRILAQKEVKQHERYQGTENIVEDIIKKADNLYLHDNSNCGSNKSNTERFDGYYIDQLDGMISFSSDDSYEGIVEAQERVKKIT